jgi:hypothetical protein
LLFSPFQNELNKKNLGNHVVERYLTGLQVFQQKKVQLINEYLEFGKTSHVSLTLDEREIRGFLCKEVKECTHPCLVMDIGPVPGQEMTDRREDVVVVPEETLELGFLGKEDHQIQEVLFGLSLGVLLGEGGCVVQEVT